MPLMNKPAIIIDVDLTIVESGWPWMKWMTEVYGTEPNAEMMNKDLEEKGYFDYNLSVYFPDRCKKMIQPYDYWEDPFLYDKMLPIENAVQAIMDLYNAGHPIRFVSYCKKGHFSSKVRFLKRHFPLLDLDGGTDGCGFYATKYKAGVAGSYIIDDRNDFLNQFGDHVVKIKYDTPFTQKEEPRCQYDLETMCWIRIRDFILGKGE
jgi:hypothetical protein